MIGDLIYMDNNSTTQVDERVFNAMYPYFRNIYGNASSSHDFGQKAKKIVELSREKVAHLINCNIKEIIFTSGATESINAGIKGLVNSKQQNGNHIITCTTEHKAVLDTCRFLETVGFDVTYLPVGTSGVISIQDLKDAITERTILISVMYVNNETGIVQPIEEIGSIARSNGIYFFCDATQAVGKIDFNTEKIAVDLVAFSAHKFHGPKGIGCLYVRNGLGEIQSLIHGGGQEFGFRSGTSNVPSIVGVGEACEVARIENNTETIKKLRDRLENGLLNSKGSFINGSAGKRIYNTVNICFPGVDANVLIGKLKNIAVSNGSACTSALVQPSHVLMAMGLSEDEALSSVRFSLSKFNTEAEVESVISTVTKLVSELKVNYA